MLQLFDHVRTSRDRYLRMPGGILLRLPRGGVRRSGDGAAVRIFRREEHQSRGSVRHQLAARIDEARLRKSRPASEMEDPAGRDEPSARDRAPPPPEHRPPARDPSDQVSSRGCRRGSPAPRARPLAPATQRRDETRGGRFHRLAQMPPVRPEFIHARHIIATARQPAGPHRLRYRLLQL